MLPGQATWIVEQVTGQMREQSNKGLLFFGIIATLWSASSGVRGLMHTLNTAYHVEPRPTWNVVISLQRLGLALGTMHLISVPGRKSGKLRTKPVSPLTVDATSSPASTKLTGLRTYGWSGEESSPVTARRKGRPWSRLAPYFAFLVLGSPDLMIFWFFAVTTKC